MQRQFSGERIVFSTNDAETIGYVYVKEKVQAIPTICKNLDQNWS